MDKLLCIILVIHGFLVENSHEAENVDGKLSRIWGPGLKPQIVMPARYFFVEYFDSNNKR